MDWNLIWEYFGNFNDREFFQILVMTCFVFGIPLAIGIFARVIGWSVKQLRDCHRILDESASVNRVT